MLTTTTGWIRPDSTGNPFITPTPLTIARPLSPPPSAAVHCTLSNSRSHPLSLSPTDPLTPPLPHPPSLSPSQHNSKVMDSRLAASRSRILRHLSFGSSWHGRIEALTVFIFSLYVMVPPSLPPPTHPTLPFSAPISHTCGWCAPRLPPPGLRLFYHYGCSVRAPVGRSLRTHPRTHAPIHAPNHPTTHGTHAARTEYTPHAPVLLHASAMHSLAPPHPESVTLRLDWRYLHMH